MNDDEDDPYLLSRGSNKELWQERADEEVVTYAVNLMKKRTIDTANDPLFFLTHIDPKSFKYVVNEYPTFFRDNEMYNYAKFLLPDYHKDINAGRSNIARLLYLGKTVFTQRTASREDLYQFLYLALQRAGATEMARALADPQSEVARVYFRYPYKAPKFVQERARNPNLGAEDMKNMKERELGNRA